MCPQVAEHLGPLAGQLAAYLLEGKEQAQVGAVLRPRGEQREDRVEDVLDRPCGVALDVREQMLGLPVLRAFGVDRGVEVLLSCGFPDSRGPPGAGAPVDGLRSACARWRTARDRNGAPGDDTRRRSHRGLPTTAILGWSRSPAKDKGAPDTVVTHRRGNGPQRTALEPPNLRGRRLDADQDKGRAYPGNSARMSLRGIAGLLPGVRQARAEGRAVPHTARTCECVGGTHRGRGDDDREYARAWDSPKKAPATPIRGSAWPARSGCAWNSGPARTPRWWVLRPGYSQVMIRLRP